jgi:hypothetical protein
MTERILISGHCERSEVHQLPCLAPMEFHSSSPDSFAVWADSGGTGPSRCSDPSYYALTWTLGMTSVFTDSIYFRQEVALDAGNVLTADGRVDAQVRFRVPAGQQFRYTFGGSLQAADFGVAGSYGVASVTLSRVDPGEATVLQTDSVKVVLVPGEFPRAVGKGVGFHGTLTEGDYLFEAHTRGEAVNSGTPSAHLWIRFYEYPKPTSVEPTTWSAVKGMFR